MNPTRRLYRDPVMAQEISWDLADAGCKHLTGWWTARERAHASSADPLSRSRVLYEIAQVCSVCPQIAACALRAEADGYTGLAAASAYRNGRLINTARTNPVAPHTQHRDAS